MLPVHGRSPLIAELVPERPDLPTDEEIDELIDQLGELNNDEPVQPDPAPAPPASEPPPAPTASDTGPPWGWIAGGLAAAVVTTAAVGACALAARR